MLLMQRRALLCMRGQVLRSLTDTLVVVKRIRVNKELSGEHIYEQMEQVAKRVTCQKKITGIPNA